MTGELAHRLPIGRSRDRGEAADPEIAAKRRIEEREPDRRAV
jgi:hypothetical protein